MPDAPAILCIDDEPDAIKIRKLLLESEGYRVFGATTGEEGLRLFQQHKIDAVVVDYRMSGMNGLAVAPPGGSLIFVAVDRPCAGKL